MKNPRKHLPQAIILSMGFITLVYTLFNFALYRVLPASEVSSMISAGNIYLGNEVALRIMGNFGKWIVLIGMAIGIIGTVNGDVLVFPRTYYAMAKGGYFPKMFTHIDERGIPLEATLASSAMAIILVIFNTLQGLTDLLIFTSALSDSVRILSFFISAFLLCFVITADTTDERRLRSLMAWIYAAVILTSLYAIAQRFMGVEVSASYTDLDLNAGVPGRVYSTLDNPNNYAEFLVLFTPLCVSFAMNRQNPTLRFVLSCCIVFPLAAIVMTYSRSSWLSLAVAAVVFVYYVDKRLIPIGFVCIPLVIPFLPDSIITRFSTIFNSHDSSASHRIRTWQSLLPMLRDHGFTGIGMGPTTFADLYPSYALTGATKGVYHTQMLYMELFIETGALGFVSFMWLMLREVKNAAFALFRAPGRETRGALIGCCASFIGIAVASVFEYIWFYPRVLFAFFILLGICLACIRMCRAGLEASSVERQ